ncbi:DoxX family protein [Myxococcaceae bacterium GXIMD 01537]
MQGRRGEVGWLVVRVVFGLTLALGHGLPKVLGGMTGFAQGVEALGFPAPLFFAWCAALAELVALFRHRADPFGRMELALLYLTVFATAVLVGGGPFSLDARLRARRG